MTTIWLESSGAWSKAVQGTEFTKLQREVQVIENYNIQSTCCRLQIKHQLLLMKEESHYPHKNTNNITTIDSMHHLNEQHIQRQKCTLCSRLHYPLAQSANSENHYTFSKTKPRLINAPRIQIAADKNTSADCATNASFANSRVSKLMSKEEESQESYIIMPTSRRRWRRRRRKNKERERRKGGGWGSRKQTRRASAMPMLRDAVVEDEEQVSTTNNNKPHHFNVHRLVAWLACLLHAFGDAGLPKGHRHVTFQQPPFGPNGPFIIPMCTTGNLIPWCSSTQLATPASFALCV